MLNDKITKITREIIAQKPDILDFQLEMEVYTRIKQLPQEQLENKTLKDILELIKEIVRIERKRTTTKRETQTELPKEIKESLDKTKPRKSTVEKAKEYKRQPNISELNLKINSKGVYTITPKFRKGSGVLDGGKLRNHYYDLIKEKTLKDDPKLMNDIITNRKKILQHRITCQIYLYSKGKLCAGLKAFYILVEQGQDTVEFWEGTTIDPSSFPTMVKEYESRMRRFGVKQAIPTLSPSQKETVDQVDTTFTFA